MSDKEKDEEKPIVAKTAVDLQRLKLMKLMKNIVSIMHFPNSKKKKDYFCTRKTVFFFRIFKIKIRVFSFNNIRISQLYCQNVQKPRIHPLYQNLFAMLWVAVLEQAVESFTCIDIYDEKNMRGKSLFKKKRIR